MSICRGTTCRTPTRFAAYVLIDEIELHLHPKWQRDTIPALTRTFPNCQFIVTTHSPQVISQVKPIPTLLPLVDNATNAEIQKLIQGYEQRDSQGNHTPFCFAIAYSLRSYYISQ